MSDYSRFILGFTVVFDSKADNSPIASGESQEKYVSWKPGRYQITTYKGENSGLSDYQEKKYYSSEEYGDLFVTVFTEDGQRVASDEGNFRPGQVNFWINKTTTLKIKVTRAGGTDKNKMHFWMSAMNDSI
ncbi:MAG: hypothetical protein SWX82_27235 [Cyanobacteriota bacterium]|nr:hypothetical protein [Cyanobacteriota bacterium]